MGAWLLQAATNTKTTNPKDLGERGYRGKGIGDVASGVVRMRIGVGSRLGRASGRRLAWPLLQCA